MDDIDRKIINALQGGFPIAEQPYAEAAEKLGLDEATLISRLDALLADGTLSRFGPLYDAERLGGAVTLAAMAVPDAHFDAVCELVNDHPEVAHNYARDHAFNMWFVVAAESRERIDAVLNTIEAETGCDVFDMPKEETFFLQLRLRA
jgi:DNA-binding Lrp family transcriptional regulator